MTAGVPMVQAALEIAASGLFVFPCSPETKRPLTHSGFKNASADPATVKRFWQRVPSAMIGVPTGHAAGAFVIDIDAGIDESTGEVFTAEQLVASLEAAIGECLPATRSSRTPRGGLHLWFRIPEGEHIGNRAGMLPRIDVRGDGGYVVAPPSIRADGAAYAWQDPGAPITDPPTSLVDMILKRGRFGSPSHGSPSRAMSGAADERMMKYALAALAQEISAIEKAPSGSRNQVLNDGAMKIAQLVAAGALSESIALSAIKAAAESNPGRDSPRAIEATIASGWNAGLASPRDLSDVATEPLRRRSAVRLATDTGKAIAAGKPPEPHDQAALDRRCCMFPLTDLGNAERFAARYADRVRWIDKNEIWAVYDGRCWVTDGADSLVEGFVYGTVRAIRREAELVRASGRKDHGTPGALDDLIETKRGGTEILLSDKIEQWARISESKGHISCISSMARPLGITIQPDAFDRNPFLIAVLNGTLELHHDTSGEQPSAWIERRDHNPADLISRLMPVVYDPKAECRIYDRFLARIQPSEAMRRYLHQWAGYNLTGDVGEQKLHFWHGRGANGKSTLIDTWAAIMGRYSTTLPIESFLDQGRKKTGSDHTADLIALVGVRMVRTSEPEKGAKLAEALIKLVTGGEPIPVREPYAKRGFDLAPAFKLTISGNHRPQINGTDDGIWRRPALVPFDVQIPEEEKDRKLIEKLRGEVNGIFNRMLAGMVDWRLHGLIEPDAVKVATARYRDDSDALGRFLSLCTREAKGQRVQSSKLHTLFLAWVKVAGEREWSQMGFSKAMLDRGFEKKQSDGVWWLDIETTKEPSDFLDSEGRPRDFNASAPLHGGFNPSPLLDDDDDDWPL